MRTLLTTSAVLLLASIGGSAALQSQPGLNFIRFDNATNAAPRSIVSADFDRDGFPDVALGGTNPASIGILLHHGLEEGDEGQRFKVLREISVGGGPFDLAAADLNRDGWPDLAVANADSNAVTILLNDHRNPFTSSFDVPVAENPRGLAVGDFNRDGAADIVVTKFMGTSFDVLYGSGDGTFPTRRTYPAPANAQGVVASDLNNDGRPDVAVVSASGLVSVNLMDASGDVTRADEQRPYGWNVVTVGDFDRNGWKDLAYASTASSVVEVMYRFRDGGQGWSGDPIPVAASPRGIETADMNQDGVLDLVVAGRTESTVTVLIRDPASADATVYTRHDVAAATGARDVALADFNDDGRMDVLTANEYASSTTVLANGTDFGSAGFTMAPMPLSDGGADRAFAAVDFDQNGRLDILKPNAVLFEGTRRSRTLGAGFASSGAAGDFNGDGSLDAALSSAGVFQVFFGDGSGNFADGPRTTTALAGMWGMHAADVNRDGHLDVVVLVVDHVSSAFVQVFIGRGDGTFATGTTTPVAPSARSMRMSDLDRDGIPDAVVPSRSGVQVFLGNGADGWRVVTTLDEGVPRSDVAIGDVTSDGVPDLVMADMRTESWGITWGPMLTVARGRGDGMFELANRIDVSSAQPGPWFSIYVVNLLLTDLNADGQLDIVTSSGHFIPGFGGGFGGAIFGDPQPFRPQASFGMLAADMNADGLVDLLGFRDYEGGAGEQDLVVLNTRGTPASNRVPEGVIFGSRIEYPYSKYFYAEDEPEIWAGYLLDPDLHQVRMTWIFPDGRRIFTSNRGWAPGPEMTPGTYEMTLVIDDFRGGTITRPFTLVMTPHKESVIHPYESGLLHGAWQIVSDPTALVGRRAWHPNANAPKLQTPLANPTDYIDIGFLADPTQEYKLWIRMKADDDNWSNDSVFVQFSGARDAAGNPVYEIGTTSALAVNLEECSNCGVSGWGWEDDGWGAPDRHGVTLRFPEGGRQLIRIQTREDGVSIDQIVLSAERYKTTRPGSAKNDNTLLQSTGPWMGTWWFNP